MKTNEHQKIIAIQGEPGSFHHQAAIHYYGKNIEILPCKNFNQLIRTVQDPSLCDGGMMAIENSIAGSIMTNYGLLQRSKLQVTGEIYCNIQHHLLVYPGTTIVDIAEVHSHPMAFLQCMPFLEEHNWTFVEKADTATAAKEIMNSRSKSIAAIAGHMSAELYGLEMLRHNIHEDANNYTRFLALAPQHSREINMASTKASVSFITSNNSGSLAAVLDVIAEKNVNLTKMQSHPITKTIWEYMFYIDMEFKDLAQFNDTIHQMRYVTEKLRVFGIYEKGQTLAPGRHFLKAAGVNK